MRSIRCAELYEAQNKYAEAEPLLKRSLSIREKAPGQPDVAASRQRLAVAYDKMGRASDAQAVRGRTDTDILAKKSGGAGGGGAKNGDAEKAVEASKQEAERAAQAEEQRRAEATKAEGGAKGEVEPPSLWRLERRAAEEAKAAEAEEAKRAAEAARAEESRAQEQDSKKSAQAEEKKDDPALTPLPRFSARRMARPPEASDPSGGAPPADAPPPPSSNTDDMRPGAPAPMEIPPANGAASPPPPPEGAFGGAPPPSPSAEAPPPSDDAIGGAPPPLASAAPPADESEAAPAAPEPVPPPPLPDGAGRASPVPRSAAKAAPKPAAPPDGSSDRGAVRWGRSGARARSGSRARLADRAGLLGHRPRRAAQRQALGVRLRPGAQTATGRGAGHRAEDARGAERGAAVGGEDPLLRRDPLRRERRSQEALHRQRDQGTDQGGAAGAGEVAPGRLEAVQGSGDCLRARLQHVVRQRALPDGADRLRHRLRRRDFPLQLAVGRRRGELHLRPRERPGVRTLPARIPRDGGEADRRQVRSTSSPTRWATSR